MQHRLPRRVVVLVNAEPASHEQHEIRLLDTARAAIGAIESLDVEVSEKRITNSLSGLAFQVGRLQADVVFNLVEAIHGDAGRAWQVPALLDRHRIAYTGNAALPLRICRNKDKARRALNRERLPVAADFGNPKALAPISVFIFPDPNSGYAVSTGAEPSQRAAVEALAYKAFSALSGTGYGRVDLQCDEKGHPCVVDVDPNCDLHPAGGLTVGAKIMGWDYATLIASLLEHALHTHERVALEERSHL